MFPILLPLLYLVQISNSIDSPNIAFQWKQIDFQYPTPGDKWDATTKKEFIPENNLPLGLEIYGDRMFITLPRWKEGVAASLAYIKKPEIESFDEAHLRINVRALISEYENKTTNVQPVTPRARTRSLGNILAKKVVVKVNEFRTLDDVQRVLETIELRLNKYDVYNKEKHVMFQEELFNILTSIINVDNDDPERAKALILETKNLVSFLNTKLPSNNLTANRYETYSIHVAKLKDTNLPQISQRPSQTTESVNKSSEIEEVDATGPTNDDQLDSLKNLPSVKSLKEKFQKLQPETKSSKELTNKNKEANLITQSSFELPKKDKVLLTNNKIDQKHENKKVFSTDQPNDISEHKPAEVFQNKTEEKTVSVLQLRSIFETKCEEGARGLPLILKEEKTPITRFNYKTNEDSTPEDLKHIEVSSYISSPGLETKGLLQILKEESHSKKEFKYELKINDDNEDNEEPNHHEHVNGFENSEYDPMGSLEYIENGNADDNDVDDDESTSSSEDSLKSVDSVKMADNNTESKNAENIGRTEVTERKDEEAVVISTDA